MARLVTTLLTKEAYMQVSLLAVVFLFTTVKLSISVLVIHMKILNLNHLIISHPIIPWTTNAQRGNWGQRASVSKLVMTSN